MSGVFRFKHFEVRNELSAMKINTDGVLLGAIVPLPEICSKILDIGTGTGVIALMLAYRTEKEKGSDSFSITAIEKDSTATEEAAGNFAASQWACNIKARNIPLERFRDNGPFDLIVSNPPYYDSSLTNPNERKAQARHTDGNMSYREIIAFATSALSPEGRLAMILPANNEVPMLRYARSFGLQPYEIVSISSSSRKPPSRIIVTLIKTQEPAPKEYIPLSRHLTIMHDGQYSQEYLEAIKDFYLFA